MSNPDAQANDTQQNQDQDAANNSEPSFADKVNDVVKGMTQNGNGEWVMPEGEHSEEVIYAATAEKRLRDTQSAFSKDRQKVKALENEKALLLEKSVGNVSLNLSAEQKAELDDLKFEDPEAWRRQMNTLETEARTRRASEIDEELKQVSTSSLDNDEKERRVQVLNQFIAENEGFVINDDILKNDIPPRITKKLETGNVSFEEFLVECRDYLKTGKVIKQEDVTSKPNLSKAAGNGSPDPNAVAEDFNQQYAKTAF